MNFRFSLQDNDSYAFREYPKLNAYQRINQTLVPDMSGKPRGQRCSVCGELLSKWDESLAGFRIRKRRYDISISYDGILVASERFQTTCTANHLTGLTFTRLPSDATFFAVQATKSVPFDAEQRKTRFLKQCENCGSFESVVGATPVYLKQGASIGSLEFVRTDLEFGSGDGKHPLLLCGENAADILRRARLKGLDLEPIREVQNS